uniref:Fido domain-containing protein n=1 Tax=Glossina austeni TaxID=7395 RepID=A0A1A9UIU2_GLOAU
MKYINASLDGYYIDRHPGNPSKGFRPSGHLPPGPGVLSILMEFENWLNLEQSLNLHPIKLATLAHYKLVHIHPFIDGSGRPSRLVINTLLMRAGYAPVIIPKQQSTNKTTALEM